MVEVIVGAMSAVGLADFGHRVFEKVYARAQMCFQHQAICVPVETCVMSHSLGSEIVISRHVL